MHDQVGRGGEKWAHAEVHVETFQKKRSAVDTSKMEG
jgi:hypothetical protein